MIGRIQGNLIEKQPPYILVDVNGVGYDIQVSMNTFYRLPELNQTVTLSIQHIVREDASLLYGFIDSREKLLFQHLIKTSGVGPKTALAILSGLTPDEFMQCVAANDIHRISATPGIGKKTAERLVIEMRDQLSDWEVSPVATAANNAIPLEVMTVENPVQEAMTALIALGYKPQTAKQMVSKIKGENLTSEKLIRLALKNML